MMNVHDHTGKLISISQYPTRIISLVPSQTELLYDLGLDNRVVGITKFCVHPEEWFKHKTKIGGTKNVHIEAVKSLQPDLIIANKEENVKEQIEDLDKIAPVFTTIVYDLPSALRMIQHLGEITDTFNKASEIVNKIEVSFSLMPSFEKLNALYLIWKNPYMAAGGDTFISQMLHYAGFKNLLSNVHRYPDLTEADIVHLNPNVIFLSSEPYPFKEKHIEELKSICPEAKIILVNGEYFSWYGSRLIMSPDYFINIKKNLIHNV